MDKELLKKKQAGPGKNAFDCVLQELEVMQRLEHPNIIFLHEIINDPKKAKFIWLPNGRKKDH